MRFDILLKQNVHRSCTIQKLHIYLCIFIFNLYTHQWWLEEWPLDKIGISLVIGRIMFLKWELIVSCRWSWFFVLSALSSDLNQSSFVFIVASSPVFLFQYLCWIFSGYTFIKIFIVICCERRVVLYWASSVDGIFLLSSWIWSDKVWSCF